VKLVRMTDAAYPPQARAPAGAEIVAGYIGGNTPHVWSKTEWAQFGHVRKLPIFVRDQRGDGEEDGCQAVGELARLGVPRGATVAYDLETLVYGAMVTAFWNVLRRGGYHVWVYGSADFVFGNPSCSGYWVADYTGQPFMYPHSRIAATQYEANVEGWDWSEVKGWQYTHRLWK
jgi:hypothetical protein